MARSQVVLVVEDEPLVRALMGSRGVSPNAQNAKSGGGSDGRVS